MIRITIGKKSYNLPTFKELSINKFIELTKRTDDMSDMDLVAMLAEIPIKKLRSVNRNEFAYFMSQVPSYYTEYEVIKESADDIKSFEFEGEEFKVPKDIGHSTIAQWFDINQFLTKDEEVKNEFELYARIVAVYCLKKTEKIEDYDGTVAIERAKAFGDMPFAIAYKIVRFFLRTDEQLSRAVSLYFQRVIVTKKAKPSKESLQTSGVAT